MSEFVGVGAKTEKLIKEIRELRRQEGGMDDPVKKFRLREKKLKLMRKLIPGGGTCKTPEILSTLKND